MSVKSKPIVIMGASTTGKTYLALKLARKIKGEIISADSRQIYKYLCAGIAKPEGRWIRNFYKVDGIDYHMVDFLDPDSTFDAASFCTHAEKLETEIKKRGSVAIFAGGTGLYLHSFFIGLDKLPPANETIRKKLTGETAKKGNAALYEKLKKVDPVSAAKIPAGNTQRLIRAIEVYQLTGKPISSFHTKKTNELPADKALFVLLDWDKKLLHKRIKTRTKKIFGGMVTETKNLIAKGYRPDCPALRSLGYSEILQYLGGSLTKTQALEKIIRLTKAYAKRQVTWFKRYKNVFLINITKPTEWRPKKLTDQIIKEWKK
jgi:tRNA dimethylallyltransferase